jgi:hypothetical protein
MLAEKRKYGFRIATENNINTIHYNIIELEGMSNLTPRARRYLSFFITVVKLGYTAISVSMESLAASIYRCQGQTKSVRTLRSALRELESFGFLHRNKYRIGDDHFRTVILLNAEKYSYWTKKRHGNITPITTSSHNSGYRQNMPKEVLTSKQSRVNSQDYYYSENNKPCARTRSNNNAIKRKFHPIIYTLMIVLKHELIPDRNRLLSMAAHELNDRQNAKSGIDYDYWECRWPFMDTSPGGERETTAKREIIPKLRTALCPRPPVTDTVYPGIPQDGLMGRNLQSRLLGGRGHLSDSPSSIRAMIQRFLHAGDSRPDEKVKSSSSSKVNIVDETVLTEHELCLLTGARNRTKQAFYNDW